MVRTSESLAHLSLHPGWRELKTVANQRIEKRQSLLVARLMSGDANIDDVVYERGFRDGLLSFLKDPERAARELEKEVESG